MALISWNCHGYKPHVSDLRDLINQYQPSCLALQETYLNKNKSAKIKRYSTFRKDHTNGDRTSGGVAIFTSHDYPSTSIKLNTDLQAVAIQIHINSLVTICNLYLPPNSQISQRSLNNLVRQLPTPFIILGDFNGHNPLWGSPDLNFRGRQIEQLLSDYDLCLFNNKQITYLHMPTKSFHSLDLAICSPQVFPWWTFSVDPYLHNSDHFPIILSHNFQNTAVHRSPRYLEDFANWDRYQNLS
jgi:hypothetical protein